MRQTKAQLHNHIAECLVIREEQCKSMQDEIKRLQETNCQLKEEKPCSAT